MKYIYIISKCLPRLLLAFLLVIFISYKIVNKTSFLCLPANELYSLNIDMYVQLITF